MLNLGVTRKGRRTRTIRSGSRRTISTTINANIHVNNYHFNSTSLRLYFTSALPHFNSTSLLLYFTATLLHVNSTSLPLCFASILPHFHSTPFQLYFTSTLFRFNPASLQLSPALRLLPSFPTLALLSILSSYHFGFAPPGNAGQLKAI